MALGNKQQLFQRQKVCIVPHEQTKKTDVLTTIDCMTECISTEKTCIGLAYDSVNKECFLSWTIGSMCSPFKQTYRGKDIFHCLCVFTS